VKPLRLLAFARLNPQPSTVVYEVSGADILIHVNYLETLKAGLNPTEANWNTTGLTVGGAPDTVTVLDNEVLLTYTADSKSGDIKVSQTAYDSEARLLTGMPVGIYTDKDATL